MSLLCPVRCFTCNKVIAQRWPAYCNYLEEGRDLNGNVSDKVRCDALNSVGLSRYCCRRMFLGHVDMIDNVLLYTDTTQSRATKKPEEKTMKRVYLAR